MQRWDTSPLRWRVPWTQWSRWRAFRRAVARGEYGDELTARHWWKRYEYALAAAAGATPLALLAAWVSVEGVGEWRLLVAVSTVVAILALLGFVHGAVRRDCWGPRARATYRLSEFARVNGLTYQAQPPTQNRAAVIFERAPTRRDRNRFEAPGPRGFVLCDHQEIWDDGPGETTGTDSAYLVLRLRESLPHTLVARRADPLPRRLRHATPLTGPGHITIWSTQPESALLRRLLDTGVVERARSIRAGRIEIIGTEIFLLTRPSWRLSSPRFWRGLADVTETLVPFLADPTPSRSGTVRSRPGK